MLSLLPTPIGNIEDLSYRTVSVLKKSEVVFCEDTRVSKRLFHLIKEKLGVSLPDFEFISLHSHNEQSLLQKIDKNIFEKNCVYMSDAGMPGISDPGSFLVRFCQDNNIEYEVLPGANAALMAFVMSGFDSKEFIFYGFLPHKQKERLSAFKEIANFTFPVILYESPHRIKILFDELAKYFTNNNVFATKEMTKLHQKQIKTTCKNLPKSLKNLNSKGEWCIVLDPKTKDFDSKDDENYFKLFKESNFPKKEASKILSKLTKIPAKKCYLKLL